MGLFGKKKAKTDAADEMFKQFGQETNDIKAPATRKEGKEQVQSAQIAEVKKDQLMDRFNYLRKMMYQHSDFDEYSNRLEDIIVKLRQMPDNENVRARSSVDNFIVNSLKEAVNYCNRGNYIAMGACIDIIDGLVDDRYQCGDYYLDPNFIKFKIQRNKYYIEQQNQQSAYDKLTERMKKLQADANNPNLHVSKENIARQAMQIKAEGKRIQTFLDSLESKIQLLDKSISEIRQHVVAHADDNEFDMEDEIAGVLGLKRENEMDETSMDKLNEKMDESHRSVSSYSLGVNENVFDETTEELSDDLFKM